MQELGNFPILASFFAGLLSFISPCVLSLMPVYVTIITGLSVDQLNDKKNLKTILTYSLIFILGFTTIFIIFGLSATYIGKLFADYITLLRYIGAIIVMIFALHLIGVFRITILHKQFSLLDKINKTSNYLSIFFIGCAFAISWTPCVDPILASILILASTQETIYQGMKLLLCYSLGLAVPFILMAVFINRFLSIFNKLKQYYRVIEIITGILLFFVGVLILTNNFSKILNIYL